jgi:hypothetical protein
MMATGSSDWRGGNSGIIVHGDFNAGQVAAGDRARAVMNVGSGARLHIGSRHAAATQEDPRAALAALLRELEAALRAAPRGKAAEADLVSAVATQLVKAAGRPDTERSTLQHISDGLKGTLGFLKGTVPDAIGIVRQLVSLVASLHGLSV